MAAHVTMGATGSTAQHVSAGALLRAVLRIAATVWFLIVLVQGNAGDPSLWLSDYLRGLTLGIVLVTASLIDWSSLRGWGMFGT